MSGVNLISLKNYILFEIYKFQNYILGQFHDKKGVISCDIINAPEHSGAHTFYFT